MNELQVKALLRILRETEEVPTIKAIEAVFVEEAKKWTNGRPDQRPKKIND